MDENYILDMPTQFMYTLFFKPFSFKGKFLIFDTQSSDSFIYVRHCLFPLDGELYNSSINLSYYCQHGRGPVCCRHSPVLRRRVCSSASLCAVYERISKRCALQGADYGFHWGGARH